MTTPTAPLPRNPVAVAHAPQLGRRRITPMFQPQALPLFHAFRA